MAGNLYPYDVIWELPFFPGIGDSLDLQEIVSEEQLNEMEQITFSGLGPLSGFEVNLYQVINDGYKNRINEINWTNLGAQIFINVENFSLFSWKENRTTK